MFKLSHNDFIQLKQATDIRPEMKYSPYYARGFISSLLDTVDWKSNSKRTLEEVKKRLEVLLADLEEGIAWDESQDN